MNLAWEKMGGLIPAIVQDADTHKVLMLGYMNEESLRKTRETEQVTFYSRSKLALWTKGETSGNVLKLVSINEDCDQDALLITCKPVGPTCHRDTTTCFEKPLDFLADLENIIEQRRTEKNSNSYVAKLFASGLDRIIQKVGEEAVEVVISAKNENKENLVGEASDLLFHLLVLLKAKNLGLEDLTKELSRRHAQRKAEVHSVLEGR